MQIGRIGEGNERWLKTDMSEGVEIARTTFYRHKLAIEEIFGIYIECDKNHNYYIGNEDVLQEDSVQNWMLSTLSVGNIISEGLSLQDRILLKTVSSGGEYLPQVIEAMKKSVRVKVSYQRVYDQSHYVNKSFSNCSLNSFSLPSL